MFGRPWLILAISSPFILPGHWTWHLYRKLENSDSSAQLLPIYAMPEDCDGTALIGETTIDQAGHCWPDPIILSVGVASYPQCLTCMSVLTNFASTCVGKSSIVDFEHIESLYLTWCFECPKQKHNARHILVIKHFQIACG